jgi:hypothetical protein
MLNIVGKNILIFQNLNVFSKKEILQTMINVADIAFITPLEKNKKVMDSLGAEHIRFFEDEAIRCIQSWRKNGGWLKDIKIYVLNATKAMVQQKTINTLK